MKKKFRELSPEEVAKLRKLNRMLEECEEDVRARCIDTEKLLSRASCTYEIELYSHTKCEYPPYHGGFGMSDSMSEELSKVLENELLQGDEASSLLGYYLFESHITIDDLLAVNAIYSNIDIAAGHIAQSLNESLHKVCDTKSGLFGFANPRGQMVIPFQYDSVKNFNEGVAHVTKGGLDTYINEHGNIVIDTKYEACGCFDDGLAKVKVAGRYGFINKQGQVVVDIKYDDCNTCFYEGFATVELNGRQGIIDKQGQVIVDVEYDCCQHHGDLFKVRLGNKWGFVNRQGERIIDCIYDGVEYYGSQDGEISVYFNNSLYIIDITDKI